MRIVRRDAFSEDIIAAWTYIARATSPRIADRLLDRIEDAIQRIALSPHGGRLWEEITPPVRTRVVWRTRYLIVFRAAPEEIDLIRLIHSARDLPRVVAGDGDP